MPCASRPVIEAVAAFVAAEGRPSAGRPCATALLPGASAPEAAAVRAAAAALECGSESCVLSHPRFREFVSASASLPPAAIAQDLEYRFKAPGPRTGHALLSNFHIDDTLRRWARKFPWFFPCPYAMMDFEQNGDLLGEVDLPSVLAGEVPIDLGPGLVQVRRPATCFGCVLNTDTSRGPGKHWVAVFVDCRDGSGEGSSEGSASGSGDRPWTVEYFNSAGRPPDRPVVRWMERTRARLEAHRGGRPVRSVPVTDLAHQESQTECGLYALYYIRRRIEGAPPEFFRENLVPDAAMTAFREHIFRDR